MTISYAETLVELSDGSVVSLRAPSYSVSDLAYAALNPEAMLSPRIAPRMIGLGLLEAMPVADILTGVDENDANGDGISGRASIEPSLQVAAPMLGRFGLKAGAATVTDQSAGAFAGDMGLSTRLHPDPWSDCTTAQVDCRTAPDGQEDGLHDGLEVDRQSRDLVTLCARNLAVPERRSVDDPVVLRGKELFRGLNAPAVTLRNMSLTG